MMNTPPRFTLVPAYNSPVVESHDLGIVEKAKRTGGKARVWTTIINITFTDTIAAYNFYNEAWFQLPRGINFPATNDFHESVWLPILVEAHDSLPKVDPTGESALLFRSLINSTKLYTNKSLSGDSISSIAYTYDSASSRACIVYSISSIACIVYSISSIACIVYSISSIACIVYSASSRACIVYSISSIAYIVNSISSIACIVYSASSIACIVHSISSRAYT